MRNDQIDELRTLLRDLFKARYEGVPAGKIARAHGYVDGYMASMLRSQVISQRELLTIIGEERTRVAGPALTAVAVEAVAV
jgi:hypothetical protein